MKDMVRVFKALSDETRLRIMNLLLQRECCVCEVMQALDISQTRASRNLNILYEADLLTLKRDGLWSFYSIDRDGPSASLALVVDAVQKGLHGNATARRDILRLKNASRVGPGCGQGSKKMKGGTPCC